MPQFDFVACLVPFEWLIVRCRIVIVAAAADVDDVFGGPRAALHRSGRSPTSVSLNRALERR